MAPAFLRVRYLAPAAIGAAIFPFVVPINEGPLGKAAVIGVVWLALAYFLYTVHDLRTLWQPRTPPPLPPMLQEIRNRSTAGTAAPADARPAPQLDAADQEQIRRIVALFGRTGVFHPSAPPAEQLFESAADMGPPVTQTAVLEALHEASYHHADFDEAACMANLAFHASHTEQFDDTLRKHIADLVRLSRGALTVGDVQITLPLADGGSPDDDCVIELPVNDDHLTITYPPAAKYLSTHLHVALARVMHEAGGPLRLAWIWSDQGAWITAITPESMAKLCTGPGADGEARGGWEWIDMAEPVAAGEWTDTRS